jgi:hypothetical protein
MNSLLNWTSFPVAVLLVLVVVEVLPFVKRDLRASRWWRLAAWFWRPWAVWAVFNIGYRYFAKLGFNERTTFPFYFYQWDGKLTWIGAIGWLVHLRTFWIWSAVLAAVGLLFWLLCRWMVTGTTTPRKTALALVLLVAFGFVLPLVYDAIPLGVGDPREGEGSFARMWLDSGNTMLYCLPHVRSKGYYIRHFEEIQPQLKITIHGADHPPGASLALYWLSGLFGADKGIDKELWRYELATAAFASLGVLAMFFLGWSMFRSQEIGLMSAALWAVKPTSLAYNVFAPDTVYWVFYILCFALGWRVATAEKRLYGSMIGLGVVWAVLSLLNFNFPLLVAMFGVFLLLHAWRSRWRPAEWLWRATIPSSVFVILFLWVCVHYKLNYPAIFIYGLKSFSFYDLNTVYKWVMSLIGGHIDISLMLGSFSATILWTRFPGWARQKPMSGQVLYGLVILAFLLVSLIVLKDLKVEAGRIWAWTMAVPLVLLAKHLRDSDQPRFYFLAALVLSMLQYYGMRTMLVSAG